MRASTNVLLLREPERPVDPYERALRERGFDVRSVRVLTFSPINESALREALRRSHEFAGIVLTSPRASRRFASALAAELQATTAGLPVYCVGPATAAPVEAVGLAPIVLGDGTGASLAREIPLDEAGGPLLFLSGARRRDQLPRILRDRGARLEELHVYESRLARGRDWTARPRPNWVAYFSPSAVEATADLLSRAWSAAKRAAIGPTTAAALSECGFPAHAVASAPTPEALVLAIVGAKSR